MGIYVSHAFNIIQGANFWEICRILLS